MKSYRLEQLKISGLDFVFKKNIKKSKVTPPEVKIIGDTSAIKPIQQPINNPILPVLSIEQLRVKYSNCTKCPLHQSRTNFVYGDGASNADIMIIGEGPGAKEDQQGHVFVGPAGDLLTKMLGAIGIDRKDIFITNIVKCRPPGNRDPLPAEKEACLDYLLEQIAIIKPKVLLLFGKVAATTLINDPNGKTLGFYRNKEWYYKNVRTFVTYHPSALLHNASYKLPTWHDLQHIQQYLNNLK